MKDFPIEQINSILKQYRNGIRDSFTDQGVVGEYFEKTDTGASPRLLCQSRSLFFLAKYSDIYNEQEALVDAKSIYRQARKSYKNDQQWLLYALDKESNLDLYGYASLSYSEAWLYKISQSPLIAEYAKWTLSKLAAKFVVEKFNISCATYQGQVSQNPLMHLFESFILGYSLFNDESYKSAAIEILDLIYRHFYDEDIGAICEIVASDKHQVWYEPGHLFEWGSLLIDAQRYGISHEFIQPELLVNLAETHVTNDDFMVPARINTDDDSIDVQYRIWPHLERVRVHFMLGNTDTALSSLQKLMTFFFDSNSYHKEYLDQNIKGRQVKTTTGYHIINCFEEAIAFYEKSIDSGNIRN